MYRKRMKEGFVERTGEHGGRRELGIMNYRR
jgi:hypothetical protein